MRIHWLSPTSCKASSSGVTKLTCHTVRHRPAIRCGSTLILKTFVNIIDNVNGANPQTDASLSKFFLGSKNLGPNLHLGARVPEKGKRTLFFANPWGIAFTNQAGNGAGYVI